MLTSKTALALGCMAMLAACGSGGGSGGGNSSNAPPTVLPTPVAPAPTPSPSGQCSLSSRQDFVRAQLQEWYLFPDLLDLSVDKSAFTDIDDYIDALVAPARAASRDRFFTYLTSITEEREFLQQGNNAGFGVRLSYDREANTVFVAEAFESSNALANGIDRGTQLLEIQEPGEPSQSVATLMAQGGPSAVIAALGPSTIGVTRILTVRDPGGATRSISITKSQYTLDPVSDRYGTIVIEDNGKRVGYLNLRTFIDPARDDLIAAFDSFRAQGVSELIIDFRYNGGGLVSIAELIGDLLGAGRQGQVFSFTNFRPSKANENETYRFDPRGQSIMPTKIAFIGTGSTASASELVINAMQPYLGTNMALIGEDTFGKPVGQIAIDRPSCDDRFRIVAFATQNANRQGDYYTGLASTLARTCAAEDDVSRPLGDPREAMIATALDFLAGRSCTPIDAGTARVQSAERVRLQQREDQTELLRRSRGGTPDRDLPGSY